MTPFGGINNEYHRQIFIPAIEKVGLAPRRADDLYGPSAIVRDIWTSIRECRVGLADLTGRNPNVLYELGLAHAITKPVVLVTRTIDDVPFDLRGLRVIEYNVVRPDWAEELRVSIARALTDVLTNPSAFIPLPFVDTRPSEPRLQVDENERRQIAMEQRIAALTRQVAAITGRKATELRDSAPSTPKSGPGVRLLQPRGLMRAYEANLWSHIFRTLDDDYQWSVEEVKAKVVIADGRAATLEEAQMAADLAANAVSITEWQAEG